MGEGRTSEATPPGDGEEPFFLAWSQEELGAAYGKARREGRLSYAKELGYDSLEDLDRAVEAMKAHRAAIDEIEEKTERLQEEAAGSEAKILALRVEGEAFHQAGALGGEPSKIDDVLTLREKTWDLAEDGRPNAEAIKSSVTAVFERHPAMLRRGGPPRTPPEEEAAGSTSSWAGSVKAALRERFGG
jgi:hypothetical protein